MSIDGRVLGTPTLNGSSKFGQRVRRNPSLWALAFRLVGGQSLTYTGLRLETRVFLTAKKLANLNDPGTEPPDFGQVLSGGTCHEMFNHMQKQLGKYADRSEKSPPYWTNLSIKVAKSTHSVNPR